MNNRSIKFLILAFGLCLGLAACGPGDEPEPGVILATAGDAPRDLRRPQDVVRPIDGDPFVMRPIKIGVLLPLSGPNAPVGSALMDAVGLGLFDAYDPRLVVLPYDTRGDAATAARVAEQALADGVEIVIGPLFADSIRAISPSMREARVPVIGFSNDASTAGDGVYLLSFFVQDEVSQIIRYASDQGADSFAALIPNNTYGERVLSRFSNIVFEAGGEITALEVYEPNAQSVFEPVRRLANYDARAGAYQSEVRFLERLNDDLADEILETLESIETIGGPGFDAVLVPEGGELLRSLSSLLPFYEVDPNEVRFLGTGLWDDISLTREPSLYGGVFAGAEPSGTSAFLERFRSFYGYAPPRIATLAYDATSLIATLAREEMRRYRFSRRAFHSDEGYVGVDGLFRFRNDGTAERRLAIIRIEPGELVVAVPAAATFEK